MISSRYLEQNRYGFNEVQWSDDGLKFRNLYLVLSLLKIIDAQPLVDHLKSYK